MEDTYVRKDVYDANMKEMRALMEASEARMSRKVDQVLARHEHDADVIATAFDALKEQVSVLNSRLNWFLGVTGTFIALATLYVTVFKG